jgi:hypothetical protein
LTDSIVLDEAVSLAREHYAIFPVHIAKTIRGGSDGDTTLCTCGVSGCNGKHPAVKSFSNDSTTDLQKIHNYGQRWEYKGIGIHLKKCYCWVVDVDAPEGYEELQAITEEHVKTGGNGMHYYFAGWVDKINSGKLASHIDIKGNVGDAYVVAPPTMHHSGNRYQYINRINPAQAPDWLIDLVISKTYSRCSTLHPVSKEIIETRLQYEIPLERLLKSEQISKLQKCGDMLRGDHPIHGSKNHRNFTIDKTTNRWFCNRCESYGGFFELAAILAGVCDCKDFPRNRSPDIISTLNGKKFVSTVQYCLDNGIDEDDIKVHISRGKYARQ